MFDIYDAISHIGDVYGDLAKLLKQVDALPAIASDKSALMTTVVANVRTSYSDSLASSIAGTHTILETIEGSYAIRDLSTSDAVVSLRSKLKIIEDLPPDRRAQIDAARNVLLKVSSLLAKVEQTATPPEMEAFADIRNDLPVGSPIEAVARTTVDGIEAVFASRPLAVAEDIAEVRRRIDAYCTTLTGAEIIRPDFGRRA